jgi:transposase
MENENEKVQTISEMDIEIEHKAMLSFLINPRTIAQVAAKFEKSYTHIYQKLSIWEAKGWLHKHQSMSGKTIWQLSKKVKP